MHTNECFFFYFKFKFKYEKQTDVSPASSCYSETLNTLLFAQRAKRIVNKPKINEVNVFSFCFF